MALRRRTFLAAGSAAAFLALTVLVLVRWSSLLGFDGRVERRVHALAVAHPGFTSAMRTVSDVGSPAGWWVVVLAVSVALLIARRVRAATFAVLTYAGSAVLNRVVKDGVDRARPRFAHPVAIAHGASFPSGHAQAATVACGVLLVVLTGRRSRAIAWPAALVAVAVVAFSRVALGVHYVSDVVGGVLLGIAWLGCAMMIFGAFAGGHERLGHSRGERVRSGPCEQPSTAAPADPTS